MKFRTAYSERVVYVSPSGCRYRTNYIRGFDKEGNRILVENGKEDLFDTVQKAAPGNCIEDLLRRAESGDSSAISPVVDSFADLSNMPTDILSAHAMLQNAREKYRLLPKELRAQFGNSFEGLVKAVGDGTFSKAVTQPVASKSQDPSLTPEQIAQIKSIIGGTNE